MKKHIIALTVATSFIFSPMTFAAFPVTDVLGLAESVKMIMEAQKQLKELQDQVKTAKSQLDDFRKEAEETKKRLEGYTNFDNIFDSSTEFLKDMLKDYEKEISKREVDDYLNSKGIEVKDNTELKAQYERKIEQIKRNEKTQQRLESQSKRLDKLQREFERATTPQKREEILNTIQLENLKMQNTMKVVELEIEKQEQENEIVRKEAVIKYLNSEVKPVKPKGFIDLAK
ncbi:type IV secretion system protein [Xenorhabdus bovienii]|uniref:type IV secretion system protein n=1 Tax=Xenorhabdus bovienii TaxID=40576 RepID=UPI0023B2B94A|nr:type IV secretion system protein [Xenorhabdus bovienii]MDE9544134.1 type IV secretion system protein [Xenorhabdus bovienii]